MSAAHVTTVAYDPGRDQWGWRCSCGAWGRSLLFGGEEWTRQRAAMHEASNPTGQDAQSQRTSSVRWNYRKGQ
jgi:hypothetical protein